MKIIKLKQLAVFFVSVTFFTSCVSYLHLVEPYSSNKQLMNEKGYVLSGTFSVDLNSNVTSQNKLQEINSDSTTTFEEKLKKISSIDLSEFGSPTYYSLNSYVKQKFGENALFANVVWDYQTTNAFGLRSEKYRYVTFDLYLPKK